MNPTPMPALADSVDERLQSENLRRDEWLELLQRLLDYGVICRDESQVEADLYDRFVRLEGLVDEYLALMGVRLHHDPRFQFVRLIPPGARVPGLDDETDAPFNGGLRARLNQAEVALILTLRTEYDKALRDGQIDEQGCATLSMEALVLALKSLLNRTLPDNLTERRQLFKRLRQLRVIRQAADADFTSTESWIKVRPMIVNLVNNQLIEELLSGTADLAVDGADEVDGVDESDEPDRNLAVKDSAETPIKTTSNKSGTANTLIAPVATTADASDDHSLFERGM